MHGRVCLTLLLLLVLNNLAHVLSLQTHASPLLKQQQQQQHLLKHQHTKNKQRSPQAAAAATAAASARRRVLVSTLFSFNPLLQDAAASTLALGGTYAWLQIWISLAKRGKIDAKISRKIIHAGSAPLFMFLWPLFSDTGTYQGRLFASGVIFAQFLRLARAGLAANAIGGGGGGSSSSSSSSSSSGSSSSVVVVVLLKLKEEEEVIV